MKTNEEITKETYNKIAASYTKHTKEFYSDIRRMLDSDLECFLDNLIGVDPNLTLLIVGAGDGRDALIFNKKGFRTLCIDYSVEMKKLALNSGIKDEDYLITDIRDFNSVSTYLGIWASTCLYHINKSDLKHILIPLFYNSLADEGFLYINLFEGDGEVLNESPKSYEKGGARFYAYYKLEEISDALKENGFKLISVESDKVLFDKTFIRIIAKK